MINSEVVHRLLGRPFGSKVTLCILIALEQSGVKWPNDTIVLSKTVISVAQLLADPCLEMNSHPVPQTPNQ